MRYTFFYNASSEIEVGLYYEDGIVPVRTLQTKFVPSLNDVLPQNMLFLDPKTRSVLEDVYRSIYEGTLPAEKQQLPLAPLVLNESANIFCVGRNYKCVGAEMNRATDKNMGQLDRPAFFYKPNRAVLPSGGVILACWEDTQKLDYEGEIGIIIGKAGKDISLKDAPSYIYGYTVCNDVSARDAMKAYYQMYKGKTMDTFAPIGPCVATAEEIPDFRNMDLETRVNHELRQKGNTSDLLFDFPTVIHYLSKSMSLMPGDIVFTGTPAGIGAAMDPPSFLKDGDVVEITVRDVGTLRNTIHQYSH